MSRSARRRLAAAIAAAAGVALLLVGVQPSSGAEPALPIYGANALGRGVEASFTMRPFIFKPLVQLGVPYVLTEMNSTPLSRSMASQAWPGALVDFLFPSEVHQDYPATIRASYPSKQTNTKTLAGGTQVGITTEGGNLRTVAHLYDTHAEGITGNLEIAPGGAETLVSIKGLRTVADGRLLSDRMEESVVSTATGISLMSGMIAIEAVSSSAKTASDGVTGTADASLTVVGATAEVGGGRHAVAIDNKGVHVRDPSMPEEVNRDLDAELQQKLGEAGVRVVSGGSTEIPEGAAAEATAGGIVIDWSSISTPQGDFSGTVAITGAFANTFGSRVAAPGSTPGGPSPTVGGAPFPSGEISAVPETGPPGAVPEAQQQPGPGQLQPVAGRVPLLRARMPSQALVVPGAALLAFAALLVIRRGVLS